MPERTAAQPVAPSGTDPQTPTTPAPTAAATPTIAASPTAVAAPTAPATLSGTDPAPPPSTPQLAMGFDFGLRRIGIAAGDSLTGTAHPVQTVANHDSGPDWAQIARALAEWRPTLAVVGLPYNTDGSESATSAWARSFARELETRFSVRVVLVDERYSSLDASARLKEARVAGRRRARKPDVDAMAACVILERWFAQRS